MDKRKTLVILSAYFTALLCYVGLCILIAHNFPKFVLFQPQKLYASAWMITLWIAFLALDDAKRAKRS